MHAENGNGAFSPPTVTTQFRRYENALSTDFTDSADWNVRKTGMVKDVSQKLQDEWEFFTTKDTKNTKNSLIADALRVLRIFVVEAAKVALQEKTM
ncbi:MAG: hypothetical protein WCR06_01350 [bacterium]